MNTIAKAILELDMPESCWNCPCIQQRMEKYSWCGVDGKDCADPPHEKRRDDCPLKEKGGGKVNDVFQVNYLPEEREIKINLPEEVWNNINTITLTRLFQEEVIVEKRE